MGVSHSAVHIGGLITLCTAEIHHTAFHSTGLLTACLSRSSGVSLPICTHTGKPQLFACQLAWQRGLGIVCVSVVSRRLPTLPMLLNAAAALQACSGTHQKVGCSTSPVQRVPGSELYWILCQFMVKKDFTDHPVLALKWWHVLCGQWVHGCGIGLGSVVSCRRVVLCCCG